MNEMKPEDVMRALEHCGNWWCDGCPFENRALCTQKIAKAALALLREKDAEVERLKAQNAIFERGAEAAADIIEQLETYVFDSDKYIAEYDGSEVQKAYNKGLRDALEVAKNRGGGENA